MGQSGDMDDTAAIDVKAKELEATMQRLRETREKLLQVVSESKADPSLNPRAGPLKTKAVALAIDSALAELQQMTLASSLGELRQGSHISQDSLPGELVEKDPLAVEAGQRQVNLAMLQLTSIPTPIFQIKTITVRPALIAPFLANLRIIPLLTLFFVLPFRCLIFRTTT